MRENDPIATLKDGKIVLTTSKPATERELENAIWLRQNRAGLMASALHGGKADGFHIAISDIKTEDIQAALTAIKETK